MPLVSGAMILALKALPVRAVIPLPADTCKRSHTEILAPTRITWPMSYRICSGEATRTVQSLVIDHTRPPASTRGTKNIPGIARLTPIELGHDCWTEARRTRVLANEMEQVLTGAAPMF